jgi:hypothetical protein
MSAGTYFIRVFSRSGSGSRSYNLALTLGTTATWLQLNVPNIAQQKPLWCWAASAEMLGKWTTWVDSIFDTQTSRTQVDAVRAIFHGGDTSITWAGLTNSGASDLQTAQAVNFITSGNLNSGRFTASRVNAYSLAQIDSQVFEYHRGVEIGISGLGGGHIIVIKGIRRSDGTITLNDPWNTANQNQTGGVGIARSVQYNDLTVNGYLPSDSRTYQMTIVQNS